MANRIVDALADALQTITGVLLVLLFTLSIVQIALRYVAGIAWLWVPDVSRLLFVWVVFLGASVLVGRNEHLMMDFLVAKLGPPTARRLAIVTDVAQIAFFIVVLVGGVRVTQVRMRIPYDTVDIPSGLAYLAVPVCAAVMIVFSANNLRRSFAARGVR
jgi:TRAP-type C4-dicarboxylate transport system permease small subunit